MYMQKILIFTMMAVFMVLQVGCSAADQDTNLDKVEKVEVKSETEQKKNKKQRKLKVGDEAPLFELKNHANETVKLADFRDKSWVLLAFYPKDDSPGCTAEMKDFRDDYSLFQEAGVQALGISLDGQKSHIDFRNKFDLEMPLLSDTEKEVSKMYNVYNKMLNVTERAYYLIDKKGIIRYVQIEKMMAYKPRNEELLKIVEESIEKEKEKADI